VELTATARHLRAALAAVLVQAEAVTCYVPVTVSAIFPRKLCGLDALVAWGAPSRPCIQGECFHLDQFGRSIRSNRPRRIEGISRSCLARRRGSRRRHDGSAARSAARRLGRRASPRILVTRQTHGVSRSIGAGGDLAASCATLLARMELCTTETLSGDLTAEESWSAVDNAGDDMTAGKPASPRSTKAALPPE
jgi:hypothetical protein